MVQKEASAAWARTGQNETGRIQLYTFAMAHNLFQGTELQKVLHSLVPLSEKRMVNIIDEGILGPIPHDPRYEFQIADMRFTIDNFESAGKGRVVFGDWLDMCTIQALAPDNMTVTTLRSKHLLTRGLEELAKDESIPTLIIAGLTHIMQIHEMLRREYSGAFETNDIGDLMRRSDPDPARFEENARHLAQAVRFVDRYQFD